MNLISYKFSSEIKCLPNVNLREHMCNEQFPTVNLMINFICECCSSPYINFKKKNISFYFYVFVSGNKIQCSNVNSICRKLNSIFNLQSCLIILMFIF